MLKPHSQNRITFLLYFCLMFSFITFSTTILNSQNNADVQVQQIQGNEYSFTVNYPEYDSKDLIFWIMPNGDWKYGHQVSGHFELGTYNFGTAYILKKNDTDFGIASYPIPSFTVNSSANIQNSNNNTHALQLSSSWSAAKDHWVYTILTVSNTSTQTINYGTVSLSYPNNAGYTFNSNNTVIPNNWLAPSTTTTNANINTLNWTFNDLSPGEQKYIYIAFDIASNPQHTIQLNGSITSNEITTSKPLTLETKNYPHDPNFTRVDAFYGAEYDEYQYCYQYSEDIPYTVGFQNEGDGPAMNIDIKIDLEEEFYQISSLSLTGSSHYSSINSFSFDNTTGKIIVHFEGINLPGLNQTETKVSFQESTGYVSFNITTKCDIEEELSTDASIVFISKDGFSMPAISTNTVNATIGEIASACIFCTVSNEEDGFEEIIEDEETNKQSLDNQNILNSISLSPNPCNDFFNINYTTSTKNQEVQINILDITGKQYKNLIHTLVSKGTHQMRADVSDLNSGIYLVNIQIGGQNESYKLVKW